MQPTSPSSSSESEASIFTNTDASGNLERYASDDFEADVEDEGTGSPLRKHEKVRELPPPNRQISPFDVRFSQMRARLEFRDGSSVEEAVAAVRAIRCPEKEEEGGARVWRLEAPFPPIEVLQWSCKLRDADGRPKVDPTTGGELWDADDHVFTLDNRRLYCYQKAAAALWPDQAIIDVIELPPQSLTRMRQVRKFRTMDSGESVLLGSRDDEAGLVRWAWREATGAGPARKVPAEARVQMRRRTRGEPRNGRTQNQGGGDGNITPGLKIADEGKKSFASRVTAFCLIYAVLRLGKSIVSEGLSSLVTVSPPIDALDDAVDDMVRAKAIHLEGLNSDVSVEFGASRPQNFSTMSEAYDLANESHLIDSMASAGISL